MTAPPLRALGQESGPDRATFPTQNGSLGSSDSARYLALADALQSRWAARDDTSFDPYDGLAGTRVPSALRRTRAGRLAVVHLHKRLPFNGRRLFAIGPTKSAYTVAHFARACLLVSRLSCSDTAARAADNRLRWLRRGRVGDGWSYPFDVQTRTLHYSWNTPNIVCTAFAANAFLDAAEAGRDDALEVGAAAARFVLRELRVRRRTGTYFGYLPGDETLIHNANVLAAQVLVRAGRLAERPSMVEAGLEGLETTVRAVREDGAIPYGEGPALEWIDGHHTGFVVEAMADIARHVGHRALGQVVDAAATFYRLHLFDADGWPRPRPRARYPVDVIAAAQGIQTFARLGGENLATAKAVAEFAIRRLRSPSGGFHYQRRRLHAKRVPYARWADAPMALALAFLGAALEARRQHPAVGAGA
jgi:hypothetical protein